MKKLLIITLIALFMGIIETSQAKDKEPLILIKTSKGDIKIKLYNETPVHRDNFIKLVEEGFYDGLLFHRVIENFMIQGGDPESKGAAKDKRLGNGGPGYTLPAEIIPKYFHKKGAIAAARTGDQANPQRRSSGSQFYIVQGKTYSEKELEKLSKRLYTQWSKEQTEAYTSVGGAPFLDAQYTVFGEVIEGFDIMDKIASVETGSADRPNEDVVIESMEVVKK